jgi:tetratricopeptide (TPR) repeat protein
VLHDFLRLETEIMVKLVASVMSQHELPDDAVFEFYQRLHCATFGGMPSRTPRPTPYADLDKYFYMLVDVRQEARKYLYEDDPSEYYQGLLMYLLGALKFGNLDEIEIAPWPKRVAFVGAATVQALLDAEPPCEALLAAQVGDSHLAVLLDFEPEVKVVRKGESVLRDADFYMSLYRGDIVSTLVNAAALVWCTNGLVLGIPALSNHVVECQDSSGQPVLTRLSASLIKQMASPASVSGLNLALLASRPPQTGEPATPLLFSPRNTLLAETRPTFRWRHVRGAARYRLVLRRPDGATWSRETSRTMLSYPDDAPPLAPGSVNSVLLNALEVPGAADQAQLRVLDQASLDELNEAEALIQALPLETVPKVYLLALLYQGHKLWSAAIAQLERLLQLESRVSSEVWRQFGNLHFQIELYPQAERAYQSALAAAQESADKPAQAAAHLGLAFACYVQNKAEPALAHLPAVTAHEYENAVQFLYKEIEEMAGETPVYAGPAVLADYVRFLSETLAPRLVNELKKIPDVFMERLRALEQPRLKPGLVPVGLGDETFEAMELLAATYFTTQALAETLSEADIETLAQSGQLSRAVFEQARKTAQESGGLDLERAQSFAGQYTTLVGRDPQALRELVKQ